MKKFSIPCDFNGQKAPFTIYVGNPKPDHHPIFFQSDWLSKERGGTVPQEVMDSLAKLKDLSEKNGVSFEDLCVYALGAAQQEEIEKEALPEEDNATNYALDNAEETSDRSSGIRDESKEINDASEETRDENKDEEINDTDHETSNADGGISNEGDEISNEEIKDEVEEKNKEEIKISGKSQDIKNTAATLQQPSKDIAEEETKKNLAQEDDKSKKKPNDDAKKS